MSEKNTQRDFPDTHIEATQTREKSLPMNMLLMLPQDACEKLYVSENVG